MSLLLQLLLAVAVAALLGAGSVVARRRPSETWSREDARRAARLFATSRDAAAPEREAIEHGAVDTPAAFTAWWRRLGAGDEELPRLLAWVERWSR